MHLMLSWTINTYPGEKLHQNHYIFVQQTSFDINKLHCWVSGSCSNNDAGNSIDCNFTCDSCTHGLLLWMILLHLVLSLHLVLF
jgi:hypothetical protein